MASFSASQLLAIQLKAEQMWADSNAMVDFIPNAETAIIVSRNQTARFEELDRNGKKNKVTVTWISACEHTVRDECTPDCELDEEPAGTNKKDYEYDICFETGFSVDETELESNTYGLDEVVGRLMNNAIKLLDEEWAKRLLINIHAFAGDNVAPAPFTYDALSKTTVVPSQLYGNPLGSYSGFQLPTHLTKQALQNQMQNPYYLDNGRLWVEYQNAQASRGANDNISVAGISRALSMNVNFDLFNFAKAGISNVTTFAIDRSAIAFKTQAKHTPIPRELGGKVNQTIYSVASLVIPNVRYDVFYQLSCKEIEGETHYLHTFKLKARGMIALNPTSCPKTINGVEMKSTGVLSYVSADEYTAPEEDTDNTAM